MKPPQKEAIIINAVEVNIVLIFYYLTPLETFGEKEF